MLGRMVVVAGLLGLTSVASAQVPVRPEALLPPDTLMYFGTDDFDALRASARNSPLGRILAEQEVKEFLEKPMAALHEAIGEGLALAKQEPALQGIEFEKATTAPYGRAFFAITSMNLPIELLTDPSKLDLGFVLGVEARSDFDLVGTVKKVLQSLAASKGAGHVVADTIMVGTVSVDRLKAKDAPFSLCFANLGGISVMTLSESAITEMAKRIGGTGPSLIDSPDFTRGAAAVGAAAKGDLSVFVHVGRMMKVVRQGLDLATAAAEKEGDAEAKQILPVVRAVFDALKFEAIGAGYSVASWKDGVAVTTSYAEADASQGGIAALSTPHPIDRELLKLVPKNALGFSLGHFDASALWDLLMGALEKASPELHQKVVGGIRGAETMVAGADEQGNPNWDIRRDLIGSLSGRTMSMSIPGAGSMLGPGGDAVMWIETPNAAGLEKSLKHLVALPAQLANMPIAFKEQMHGDAKLMVLDPASLGQAAMLAGQLTLTYAILDGKFWFSTSTKALKKALDSRTTPLAENITAKADFAKHFVEPPQGAVLTSLSYDDTAANFENGYTQILGVLPMVMMGLQQGGADELPIDLSLLPTAEVISKHLHGSVAMSYSVGGGHVTIGRGPFGPELGVGVVAVAMGAGVFIGVREHRMETKGVATIPPPDAPGKTATPADQVRSDFSNLTTAITVYMIEYGTPPATLAELAQPKPEYPSGFLNGAALPNDPWGHAYAYSTDGKEHYTIWSFGPNGVDDKGAGDDVVQRG